jgi:hypothetical protein
VVAFMRVWMLCNTLVLFFLTWLRLWQHMRRRALTTKQALKLSQGMAGLGVLACMYKRVILYPNIFMQS